MTEIDQVHLIERGYDAIVEKIQSIGGDIRKIYISEDSGLEMVT